MNFRARHRDTAAHRRTRIAALAGVVVLVLLATGATGYLAWWREPAPDVAAAGAGYWVSTRGDDDNDGSADRPWKSIAHAVATAPDGSKIFVRDGKYRPFTIDRPGLTVTGAPGEKAVVRGRAGTRDVVLVTAARSAVTNLTVEGCVPKKNPDVNITGDHGSGIRVDRTTGVSIRGVTVRDSRGVNAAGLPVGCNGILVTSSRDVTVSASELYHNGTGIVISRGGRGVLVENNDVHDQDVIVQNSAAALDDFGGYGLGATFITDDPGPVFRGNTVSFNFGQSTDYGVDGGGMEIYDAANTTITGNTFTDNDGVMETGTGSGGGCSDITFTGNSATARTAAGMDNNTGLVLRCARNMVVQDNTFTGLDNFTFLLASGGDFAGQIDGLRIQHNTVTRRAGAVVYRLQIDGGTPAMTVDANRYRTGEQDFAVIGTAAPDVPVTFTAWRSRTGYDAASVLY